MIACFPVGVLAEMIHARENPWKALFMTYGGAYVDDSGTHPDSIIQVIGGFVATCEVWKSIEPDWRAVLKEFQHKGLHCFHAKDCLGQWNQFSRLTREECRYVYKSMSDILEKSNVQALWASVRNDDWAAIPNATAKLGYKTPYDFCVDRVLAEIVWWSGKHGGGMPVGLVVAEQKEHEEETQATVRSWRNHKRISELIGPITFESPDRLVQLQAADMMAHEAYRRAVWHHKLQTGELPPPHPVHDSVVEKISRVNGLRSAGHYDKNDLMEMFAGVREEK